MEHVDLLNQIKQQVIVAVLADDDLGDHLVLKGGNLLQFAYGISARASKDVDISIDGDLDTEDLKSKVLSCLTNAFQEKGLIVFDFKFLKVPANISADIESFWGGYACNFKLIDRNAHSNCAEDQQQTRRRAIRVDSSGSTRFKIDFSRHEFCDYKQEFVIGDYTIFGYSPTMFVAEKLRAICQQMPEYSPVIHRQRSTASRARDFVDIHVITEYYGIDFNSSEFQETAKKIFAKKKVPLELIGKIKDSHDHHEPDFASVRDTVHPGYDLQDFKFYFDSLCSRCLALKPLWDV